MINDARRAHGAKGIRTFKMKYASVDIGTNAVLLLIVEDKNGLHDVLDVSTIVRLGEGLVASGELSLSAMARTLEVLKDYARIAATHGVAKVFCVGTAALRQARNGAEFIAAAKEICGIDVEVISEELEARYTYLSVCNDDVARSANMVIVDIGGGSTEIIIGTDKGISGFDSLPIGSVSLTDAFITHDPPLKEEIDRVNRHIKDSLSRAVHGKGGRLIGTGGTVTNIATMIMGLESYDKRKIHGFVIQPLPLAGLISRLAALDSTGRKELRGMEKGRQDIILQGSLILQEVMLRDGFAECVVSTKGVRYGLLHEKRGLTCSRD